MSRFVCNGVGITNVIHPTQNNILIMKLKIYNPEYFNIVGMKQLNIDLTTNTIPIFITSDDDIIMIIHYALLRDLKVRHCDNGLKLITKTALSQFVDQNTTRIYILMRSFIRRQAYYTIYSGSDELRSHFDISEFAANYHHKYKFIDFTQIPKTIDNFIAEFPQIMPPPVKIIPPRIPSGYIAPFQL